MRARKTLAKLLAPCLATVHKRRCEAVLAVLEALLVVQRLRVTSIGRGLPGTPKHGIKRVDRLLSNPKLRHERLEYFRAVAALLLGSKQRPVVLIDWTQAAEGLEALVAAVPCGGRAIPIGVSVVPKKKYGNRRVQRRFLLELRRVLPDQCRPIIVADAGFRSPFMEEVSENLGWDFVIRLRGGKCCAYSFETHDIVPHSELRATAGRRPKMLGKWFPYGSRGTGHRVDAYLVLGKRGRKRRRKGPRGYQQTKAEEPWLLATSLYKVDPDRVVDIYALRMRIEEAFRDAKSHRFGWGLDQCRTFKAPRMEALLMLAALAMAVTHIVGLAADQANITRQLQANTSKRRALSTFFVGSHLLRTTLPRLPLASALQNLRAQLRRHGLPWHPGWLDFPGSVRWVGV